MTGYILAMILSYAAHRLDGPIDRCLHGITPNLLVRYCVGFFLIFVAFAWICDLPREQKEKALKALALAGMASGVGVTVGRMEDIVREAARS